jgi:hypothetical protein
MVMVRGSRVGWALLHLGYSQLSTPNSQLSALNVNREL